MKEKVIKLIQSTVWEDVLIGIELAYTLDLEEFKEIFNVSTKYKIKYPGNVLFKRGDTIYLFGYYSIVTWPLSNNVGDLFDNYKDLTPKTDLI